MSVLLLRSFSSEHILLIRWQKYYIFLNPTNFLAKKMKKSCLSLARITHFTLFLYTHISHFIGPYLAL